MAVNKVIYGAVSIIDISDSTVTADKLAKNATAYDKSGAKITGTMPTGTEETWTLLMKNGSTVTKKVLVEK